jgi:hypothetical protein
MAKLAPLLARLKATLPDPDLYHRFTAEERIRDFKTRLRRDTTDAKDALAELYELVFEQSQCVGSWERTLGSEISQPHYRGLYVIANETMPWIPWHLLRRKGEYLLARWSISYFPSLDVLYSVLTHRAGFHVGSPSAFQDDVVDYPFLIVLGTTPCAAEEAEKITERLATVGLSEGGEEGQFGIAHVAAHGTSGPEGHRFAFEWQDEKVTTFDVLRGRLKALFVFLNACDVGALWTPARDDVPLVPGLMAAGTRYLVGSYWPLRDERACAVATAFYDAWQPGTSPAEAFRKTVVDQLQSDAGLLEAGGYVFCGPIDDQDTRFLEWLGTQRNNDGYQRQIRGDYSESLSSLYDARIYFLRAGCADGQALACENIAMCLGRSGRTREAVQFVYESIAAHAVAGQRGLELLVCLAGGLVDLGVIQPERPALWDGRSGRIPDVLGVRGLTVEEAGLVPPETGAIWILRHDGVGWFRGAREDLSKLENALRDLGDEEESGWMDLP